MYRCIYIYNTRILDAHHNIINNRSTIRSSTGLRPSTRSFEVKHRLGLLAVLVQEIEHGRMMRNEVEPRAPAIKTNQKQSLFVKFTTWKPMETNGESRLEYMSCTFLLWVFHVLQDATSSLEGSKWDYLISLRPFLRLKLDH